MVIMHSPFSLGWKNCQKIQNDVQKQLGSTRRYGRHDRIFEHDRTGIHSLQQMRRSDHEVERKRFPVEVGTQSAKRPRQICRLKMRKYELNVSHLNAKRF